MNKLIVLGGGAAAAALLALFALDPRNQLALKQLATNAAEQRPLMASASFKVPFVKDPPPKREYPGRYPANLAWGEEIRLKYYTLDDGYLQTNPINLQSGSEITQQDEESQGHLRFKFNPANDPIHPGHCLVAVDSSEHTLRFAYLGAVDFDSVRTIPANRWLPVESAERPAVWSLKPGDVVGLQVHVTEEPAEATAGAKPEPPQHHTYTAKLRITKLSHDSVRFDYVYRTDDKAFFPPPALPPDQAGEAAPDSGHESS